MRILIIGGGIGGASAAVALRRAGHEAVVFERAPEPREVGAGIGLWGNGVGALRRIDLAEHILSRGEVMCTGAFLDHRGRILSKLDASMFHRQGGEALALIHRAELLEELLRPLPVETVRFGKTLVRYEQSSSQVTAHFHDGSSETGDLLIGADGLRSAVRAQMRGPEPARYSGYTCWRAVVAFPESRVPPGYVAEIWGPGSRFGITRIGRGRIYWWATINTPESPPDANPFSDAWKPMLLKSHGDYCDPVPDLIRATDAGAIIRNDIHDRRPIRAWRQGRVLLIGDAAHATTPNLGQGGCMAIEDGVCLGIFLRGGSAQDLESRLDRFVRFRVPVTRAIVNQSRSLGALGQWTHPVLRWGRDRAMGVLAGPSFRLSDGRIARFREPAAN